MKKIIITYGVIAGAIVSVIMLGSVPLYEKGIVNFDNGMVIGYTSMVVALSMVFFGIKTYRDQYLSGSITFLQGLKIGLLITIIASLMYAITWDIYYNTLGSGFTEKYTEHYIQRLQEDGATAAEIQAAEKEMTEFNEMYENFFIRFGVTLLEILPVGVLITLISAGLLRKRQILPA